MLSEKTPTRLEVAKARQQRIADQVKALEKLEATKARKVARREAIKARKAEARRKFLIGGSCIAEAVTHPYVARLIDGALRTHVKDPRDIELLQAGGFMTRRSPSEDSTS